MYQGKNPSALRSQGWLAEATVKLMEIKDFSAITIKEICREADLTRQTFYQLFSSKEDVLRYVLTRYSADFTQLLISKETINLETLAATFFHFFKEHEAFIRLLIAHRLDYLLTEQFSFVLPSIMNLCIDNGATVVSNPHINCFVVGGLSAMIIDWLKSDSTTDEEELTRLFLQLFQHG